MDQEDDFLASKYVEYRKACREIEAFTPLMPYGWFKPPQTVRLDSEFGLQQMAYRDLADDAARDLANGINHLIKPSVALGSIERAFDIVAQRFSTLPWDSLRVTAWRPCSALWHGW